jgi:hypothetical protein
VGPQLIEEVLGGVHGCFSLVMCFCEDGVEAAHDRGVHGRVDRGRH